MMNLRLRKILYAAVAFIVAFSSVTHNATPILAYAQAQSLSSGVHINVDGPLGSLINTRTGNFTYRFSLDNTLDGASSIHPLLVYNSQRFSIETLVGYGWGFQHNISYFRDGDTFYVYFGDGSVEQFVRSGDQFTNLQSDTQFEAYGDEQYRYINQDGDRYDFADPTHGGVTRLEDRNGVGLSFEYVGGALAFVRDDHGRSLGLGYTGNRVTLFRENFGESTREIRLRYNDEGELLEITDPLGNATTFTYINRLLTGISTPAQQSLTIDYLNNRVASLGMSGYRLTFDYLDEQTTRVTESLSSEDRVTEYNYDAQGRIHTITDPLGSTSEMQWDDQGNLIAFTDALGRTTAQTFDANGNLVARVDAANQETRYTYDDAGNLTTETNPNDEITAFDYDERGNVLSITDATGTVTRFTYADRDQVVSVETAGVLLAGFIYDDYGQLTATRDSLGNKTQFLYDDVGNIVQVTDANGNTVEYNYDALRQITSIVNALGQQLSFGYDAVGNLISIVDPLQRETNYTYNQLDQLVQVSRPNTFYSYDLAGNLVSVINANGGETRYEYDALNRLIREVNPLGQTDTYEYDAVGNLIRRTDAAGNITEYTYDVLDRLTAITYADGTAVEYTYDGVGRRTSMADSTGTTNYSYDANGRLTQVTDPLSNVLQYAYDALGNLTLLTYPDGAIASYEYDTQQRLVGIESDMGRVEYAYDPAGRLIERVLPNGITTTYRYDTADRLLGIDHIGADGSTLLGFEYELNAAGLREAIIQTNADGTRRGVQYGYDDLYRLVEVLNIPYLDQRDRPFNRSANLLEEYSYDAVGNRLSELPLDPRVPVGQDAYTYNAANQLIQIERATDPFSGMGAPPPTTFQYDANGNLVQQQSPETTWQYEYDLANRLTRAADSITDVAFAYNGDGIRTSKTGGDTATRYITDVSGYLPQVLVEATGDQQTAYLLGLTRLGYQTTSGDTVFYLEDGLNSVVAQADAAGSISQTRSYSSFGIPNPEQPISSFGFTGEQYDAETGLLYLRARYHMPQVGRFVTQDAFRGNILDPLSQHSYNYVYGDPINFIDPTGNVPFLIAFVAPVVARTAANLAFDLIITAATGQDVFEALTDPFTYLSAAAGAGPIKQLKLLKSPKNYLAYPPTATYSFKEEFADSFTQEYLRLLLQDPADLILGVVKDNIADELLQLADEVTEQVLDSSLVPVTPQSPPPGPTLAPSASSPSPNDDVPPYDLLPLSVPLTETYTTTTGLQFDYPEGWFVEERVNIIYLTNNERIHRGERIVPSEVDILISLDPAPNSLVVQQGVVFAICGLVDRDCFPVQGRPAWGLSNSINPEEEATRFSLEFGIAKDDEQFYEIRADFRAGQLNRQLPILLAVAESLRYGSESPVPTQTQVMEVITAPAPTEAMATSVPTLVPTLPPTQLPAVEPTSAVAEGQPAIPSPTPTNSPVAGGDIRIDALETAIELDARNCPVRTADRFGPNDAFDVVIVVGTMPAGTQVSVRLSFEGASLDSISFTLPGNAQNECLALPVGGTVSLNEGDYSVELLVNGELWGSVSFEVIVDSEPIPTSTPIIIPTSIASIAPVSNYELALFEGDHDAPEPPTSIVIASLTNDSGEVLRQPMTAGNLQAIEPVYEIQTHDGRIRTIAISPDGRLIAMTSDQDLRTVVVDITSGQILYEFDGAATKIAFSRGGRYLIGASVEQTDAVIWDMTTGEEAWRYEQPNVNFTGEALGISEDGQLFATRYEGRIVLWDVIRQDMCCILDTVGSSSGGTAVDISLQNGIVATGNTEAVTVWDINSGSVVSTLPYALNSQLLISPTGDQILVNGYGNRAYPNVALSEIGGQQLAFGGGQMTGGSYQSAAFNEVGTVLAGTTNFDVFFWSLDTILANGNIAWQSADHTIRNAHQSAIYQIAFAPSDLYLVSGDSEGYIKVWAVTGSDNLMSPDDASGATPILVDASPSPAEPYVTVNLNNTSLRSGPGTSFEALFTANAGNQFSVIGSTGIGSSQWFEVVLVDGSTAWAWARAVTFTGNLESLSRDSAITPYPTPTVIAASPTWTLTPAAVATTLTPALVITKTVVPITQTPTLTITPTTPVVTLTPIPTATITATNDPLASFVCPGTLSPRLRSGDVARVTPGSPNNVRAIPGLTTSPIGQIPGGGVFIVLEGPECADGYVWYQVNYGGLIGWTAEADSSEYWLENWQP